MKTFVRQRSFSAGPILENPLTDNPHAQLPFDPLKDKHVLRYLIHLKFCCPAKGRFYLYDNVRVVFANRVPDGKEKLRNEVQLPQPKYSRYKPNKALATSPINTQLPATKMSQRWSSDVGMAYEYPDAMDQSPQERAYEPIENTPPLPTTAIPFHVAPASTANIAKNMPSQINTIAEHPPLPYEPFRFPDIQLATSPEPDLRRTLSPVPGFNASTSTRHSPLPWVDLSRSSSTKSFSPAPPDAGDGLLSRKLRGLNGHAPKIGPINGSANESVSGSTNGAVD